MFGCRAVYVGEKIVLVFCNRPQLKKDLGIWVCIPSEHCASMKRDYPVLRGVSFFEDPNAAWQCLPEGSAEFESLALEFCALIRKGDPRIGRVPQSKRTKRHKRTES